jgi:hypothetical protein
MAFSYISCYQPLQPVLFGPGIITAVGFGLARATVVDDEKGMSAALIFASIAGGIALCAIIGSAIYISYVRNTKEGKGDIDGEKGVPLLKSTYY